ncbi:MAG: sulfotransferase domain-containing protein [Moorea sp. SIOASIH]|uniref:sulfotransferase domain-containing protein n=1 Tax=Moorena sp. SIOASIH TaxID=2607817 RepID=UPI0013B7570E|nr:sulfotransferase domain-containing protein [Moorena sp. SIOASIH]NEO41293.1 sulfotransferase domain-containing protein [Moorena sp. SIOASIH]
MTAKTKQHQKTEEWHNYDYVDSSIWNDFRFRDGDIIIATYPKSGTTWMQQIVSQLLFQGQEGLDIPKLSPWVESPIISKEIRLKNLEAQTHRRFLKSHLPPDSLSFSSRSKYIYVAREGKDVIWSFYHYNCLITDKWSETFKMMNKTPCRVGIVRKPTISFRDYFHQWLDLDGYPILSYWNHIRSGWNIRGLPNVLLVHFNLLKQDLPGQVKRIAAFLDISIKPENWERILEHCSFSYMKQNAELLAPFNGTFLEGGANVFFRKGEKSQWRNVLTSEDLDKYEQIARTQLEQDCFHWLNTGQLDCEFNETIV